MVARGKRLCAAPGSILPTQSRPQGRSKDQQICRWSLSIAIPFQYLKYSKVAAVLYALSGRVVLTNPGAAPKRLPLTPSVAPSALMESFPLCHF